MNRDPKNNECTRDPIFLLQVLRIHWTGIPDGLEVCSEADYQFRIIDEDECPHWLFKHSEKDDGEEDRWIDPNNLDFINEASDLTNSEGYSLVIHEWVTESVFLTRGEAESFAQSREYRWLDWKVYCIPCDGELASLLNKYEPVQEGSNA